MCFVILVSSLLHCTHSSCLLLLSVLVLFGFEQGSLSCFVVAFLLKK